MGDYQWRVPVPSGVRSKAFETLAAYNTPTVTTVEQDDDLLVVVGYSAPSDDVAKSLAREAISRTCSDLSVPGDALEWAQVRAYTTGGREWHTWGPWESL